MIGVGPFKLTYSILFYSYSIVLSSVQRRCRCSFNRSKRNALGKQRLSLFLFPSPRLQIWDSLAVNSSSKQPILLFLPCFPTLKKLCTAQQGCAAWIAYDIGRQEIFSLLHRKDQWIAFLAMHFSATSKASSMCSDISPAVPKPIHCQGDSYCVSIPFEPDPCVHRPNAGPRGPPEGGRWRSWREKSLGSFLAEEVCGRQGLPHSSTTRRRVNLDAKVLCAQSVRLGNSSAWRHLGKPSSYSSAGPPWNPGSPSLFSGYVMFLIATSHSEAQEAVWFGGLFASTLTRTGIMPCGLRSASLEQPCVRALLIWVSSKNKNCLC